MNDADHHPEKLLTYRQAAAILQVDPKSVYNYAKRGLLPVVRIGGVVRIDRADLEAFIRRAKTGASHGG